MNKMRLTKRWALVALLAGMLALVLAACGPAETIPASEAEGGVSTAGSGEAGESILTESGLEYIELEAGTGPAPQPGDLVKVHYTGTLEDGTEFDSSIGREPIEFPLGQGFVIPGWEEGIAMMREGGKARLIIPPELAYGEIERPGIPANSTLYFDVELVSVSPPPEVEEPAPAEPPTEVAETDFTTTDSGLKYAVLSEGSGDKPEKGELVMIQFTGWLSDGSNFGSSEGGPPVQFIVGNEEILPGWDEAVLLMQEGEKAQFIMPPELAFGAEGIPGLVPPDETVTFELELVSISPPPPTGISKVSISGWSSSSSRAIVPWPAMIAGWLSDMFTVPLPSTTSNTTSSTGLTLAPLRLVKAFASVGMTAAAMASASSDDRAGFILRNLSVHDTPCNLEPFHQSEQGKSRGCHYCAGRGQLMV